MESGGIQAEITERRRKLLLRLLTLVNDLDDVDIEFLVLFIRVSRSADGRLRLVAATGHRPTPAVRPASEQSLS